MPDTVTATQIGVGEKRDDYGISAIRYTYHLTCDSDGTGETDVQKVDISSLLTAAGAAPTKIIVELVDGNIGLFNFVKLSYDRGTDVTAAILPAGSVFREYGLHDGKNDTGSGGTGDLLLTSDGAVNGASYDLLVTFRAV